LLLLLLPDDLDQLRQRICLRRGTLDTSVLISVGQRWCETLSILTVVVLIERSTLACIWARFAVAPFLRWD